MENLLSRLVQVGTVTAVDTARAAARVKFQNTGVTSGWLTVLRRPAWTPAINETVVVLYLPVWNGDGFIIGGI